jgi:hypothetical protein
MKSIKDITEPEAIELLSFVYNQYNASHFLGISHEPIIEEDGRQQITFGGRSIVGIQYYNGQDRCTLHFDHTKAVLWLYKNGFDITELLETNAYMSEMESDFDNALFEVYYLSKGVDFSKPEVKENCTVDYYKKKCGEIYQEYISKDYQ